MFYIKQTSFTSTVKCAFCLKYDITKIISYEIFLIITVNKWWRLCHFVQTKVDESLNIGQYETVQTQPHVIFCRLSSLPTFLLTQYPLRYAILFPLFGLSLLLIQTYFEYKQYKQYKLTVHTTLLLIETMTTKPMTA